MFFKWTNASTIFQSYIHLTLREYLNIFCIVYLNDILIYSDDKNTHEKHVRLILEKFRKFKLFANLKKCYFDLDKIDYLKYLMNIMKIKINSSKFKLLKFNLNQNLLKIFNFSWNLLILINNLLINLTALLLLSLICWKSRKKRNFSKTLKLRQRQRKRFAIYKTFFLLRQFYYTSILDVKFV